MSAAAPIGSAPFPAGLGNQKLAIVGLLLAARAANLPAVLPKLVEFLPGASDLATRAFGSLFDLPHFRYECAACGIELADDLPNAAALDPQPLFRQANTAIGAACESGGLIDHAAVRLLGAMRPHAGPSARIDAAAGAWRAAGGTIACQLRVEADWRAYLARLAPRLGTSQDLTVDSVAIAAKLATTFGPAIGPVLATCDPGGLPEEPDTLAARVANATNVTLMFKDAWIGASNSPLDAALMDFELMAAAPRIVGTTLSSFFGLATLTRYARTARNPDAWAYNAPGPRLVRRTDWGAFANLARATTVTG